MKTSFALAFALCFAFCNGMAQQKAAEPEKTEPQEASLTIAWAKDEAGKPKPPLLNIALKNTCKVSLNLPDYGVKHDFEFIFIDQNSKKQLPKERGYAFSGVICEFPPGSSRDFSINLSESFKIPPGRYSIQINRELYSWPQIGKTKESFESNELRFTVDKAGAMHDLKEESSKKE